MNILCLLIPSIPQCESLPNGSDGPNLSKIMEFLHQFQMGLTEKLKQLQKCADQKCGNGNFPKNLKFVLK